MGIYNKLMRYFWLLLSIVLFLIVTVKGITVGFDRWVSYYIIVAMALGMYFFKTWMMKRFEKHAAFLAQQENKDKK